MKAWKTNLTLSSMPSGSILTFLLYDANKAQDGKWVNINQCFINFSKIWKSKWLCADSQLEVLSLIAHKCRNNHANIINNWQCFMNLQHTSNFCLSLSDSPCSKVPIILYLSHSKSFHRLALLVSPDQRLINK